MKILHVVRPSPFGGAQKMAVELVRAQRGMGEDASIVALGRRGSDAVRFCDYAAGIPVQMVTGGTLARVGLLKRLLQSSKPDLVHLHYPSPMMLCVLSRKRRFALVAHLHNRPALSNHAATITRRLAVAMEAAILRRCDKLIAVSAWVAGDWTRRYPALKPDVVYNGVPIPAARQRPPAAQPYTIGMATRLSRLKGVEEFIDLAASIHRRDPQVRFQVAGDGPMRAAYENRVRALNLSGCFDFQGFVNNTDEFWSGLTLAAFTAPSEAFGLRLIEPMALRVPAIAYRTGAGPDEVIDLCRGIIAAPYGDVEDLAGKVVELLRQPDAIIHAGRQCAADVEAHFSVSVMARSINGIYRSIPDV